MINNQLFTAPRRFLIAVCWLAFSLAGYAQDALTYQTPPKVLADLVTVPPTPMVSLSGKGDMMVILEQAGAPDIAELAQPELKLAGLRMNPANNGPSRMRYITGLKIRKLLDKDAKAITGLPDSPLISYVRWSPDDTKIAFANSTDSRIDLYVADVATATARKVGSVALNATLGTPFQWVSDSKNLIVKAIPANRSAVPEMSRIPVGPTMQDNYRRHPRTGTYLSGFAQKSVRRKTVCLLHHYAGGAARSGWVHDQHRPAGDYTLGRTLAGWEST